MARTVDVRAAFSFAVLGVVTHASRFVSLSGRCRRREQTIAHLLKVRIPDPSKSMITGWD
jgi:hypothetical protein